MAEFQASERGTVESGSAIGSGSRPKIPAKEISAQAEKILVSAIFAHSHRLARFLRFVVGRALQGRSIELKEYVLGVEVFDRKPSYDPRLDPIVRVEATRLREKLKKYYETEGRDDPVRIEFPKRSYAPVFHLAAPAVPPPQEAGSQSPWTRLRRAGKIPVLAGVAVVVVAVTYWTPRSDSLQTGTKASPSPHPASVLVLPFADLSPNRDQEYFSAGLTEELINALTRVPGLRVIPRTSAFRFKDEGHDVRKLGRELDVGTVLEGSVRKAGDRLRITVQMSDVAAGYALWAETYDRPMRDVFAVQEEISQAIVAALRGRIQLEPGRRLVTAPTQNTEAFLLYLKGRYHWNRRNQEALRTAIRYFEQALALDPQYAAAYSGLADSYSLLAHQSALPTRELMPKAKTAALRALEIDDTLAEAHSSLGYILLFYDWDWSGSERHLKRALELNPQYATAHHWYAVYLKSAGRMPAAMEEIRRAQELEPLSPNFLREVAACHYAQRQYDEAIRKCREALELDPNFASAYSYLGRAYEGKGLFPEAIAAYELAGKLSKYTTRTTAAVARVYALWGKKKEALKLLSELEAASQGTYVPPYYFALIHVALGDKDRALDHLEKIFEERSVWALSVPIEPALDPLRQEPRFIALVQKLGLP